jgi:hypothetical protein
LHIHISLCPLPVNFIASAVNSDKIRELIRHTPTNMDSEQRNMLDYGIRGGRGAVSLELTPEQYARWKFD